MPITFNTSAAVDVATGLILMYLTLSLSCAFLNEIIATALGLRAKMLEEAITRIIDIPSVRERFYNHGIIDGGRASLNRHMSYISGRNFALGLLASLDPEKNLPEFVNLANSVHKLPDSTIRDVIYMNMLTAEDSIPVLCDNIARWFEHAMHRVSGQYNRHLKAISLAVGIALAALTNADTTAVSRSLWHDSSLRSELLVSARNLSPQPSAAALAQTEQILRPLPIGWHFPLSLAHNREKWLSKIVGLLMTGIALSLGAPFWFDLLSRIINLRGAGKSPDDTAPKSALAN